MILLELFAGTRSMSRAFEEKGWTTYSVEWDKKFKNISLYADISTLTAKDVLDLCGAAPDVIWASPDCATYSILGLCHHRKKILGKITPISEYAEFCDKTNTHLLELIEGLNPRYFFIENPRGALRKMSFIREREKTGFMKRYTITYCQYGDTRQKPTDIWTNHPNPQFKKPCKQGDKCHESKPRGNQKSGTLKYDNSMDRARIPVKLCEHVAEICTGEPVVYQHTLNEWVAVE